MVAEVAEFAVAAGAAAFFFGNLLWTFCKNPRIRAANAGRWGLVSAAGTAWGAAFGAAGGVEDSGVVFISSAPNAFVRPHARGVQHEVTISRNQVFDVFDINSLQRVNHEVAARYAGASVVEFFFHAGMIGQRGAYRCVYIDMRGRLFL